MIPAPLARMIHEKWQRVTKQDGRSATLFGECVHGAQTWSRERRVVFKAEVVTLEGRGQRDNMRFVVINLRGSAESVWQDYIRRGDVENRTKELKLDLQIDRTSSTSFLANQMRVLLTAAAFVLFQDLCARLAATELGRAMVATLRLKLLKIGATVKETWRRIVVSLPTSHPWEGLWRRAAVNPPDFPESGRQTFRNSQGSLSFLAHCSSGR